MAEHTPTPWEANKQWLYAGDGKGNTTRTVPIASAQAEWVTADGGPLRDEAISNAAHIVKCVNSHDALVKAAQAVLDANKSFRDALPADWEGDLLNDACVELEAALASAQSVEGE